MACGAAAQPQLELNGATAYLRHNQQDPLPGRPWLLGPSGIFDMSIGGGVGERFLLGFGDLLPNSLPFGQNHLEIDPFGMGVITDGILGLAGALPPAFARLGSSGEARFVFPASPALLNRRLAFQAALTDPTALSGVELSAAGVFAVTSSTTMVGDDEMREIPLSTPMIVGGVSHTSLTVCTNGWIRMGAPPLYADWFPDANAFVDGSLGGMPRDSGPLLAPFWADLTTTALASSQVVADEIAPGLVVATWNEVAFRMPPTVSGPAADVPIGTFTATLDQRDTSVGLVVTYDYSIMRVPSRPLLAEGVVGVSRGQLNPPALASLDLFVRGASQPISFSGGPSTLYQDFAGQGSYALRTLPGPFDIMGSSLVFVDARRDGNFALR